MSLMKELELLDDVASGIGDPPALADIVQSPEHPTGDVPRRLVCVRSVCRNLPAGKTSCTSLLSCPITVHLFSDLIALPRVA